MSPSTPYQGQPVRNLIYHVYPTKGRGVWQWNVAQLLRRIEQFNGQRIVSVVTGPETALPINLSTAAILWAGGGICGQSEPPAPPISLPAPPPARMPGREGR